MDCGAFVYIYFLITYLELYLLLRRCFLSNPPKKKTPKKKQAFQKTILNRNLITGCFLSRCNPIMCNLLLPNALTRGRARAHSPAFQVPVLEVNYIPSISRSRSRASGSLRSLLWLSESSLRPGDKGESVGGP